MNILITGIGGPTPRSIAKTIRKKHPESLIVGVDSDSKALGFYIKGLLDHHYVIPKADDPKYWEVIHSIVVKHNIDYAFVQPENEILSWGKRKNEGYELPVPALITPIEHAELLINKALMSDLLEGTGFIPQTICITSDDPDFDSIENKIGYPCWIRASVGSGGLGALKISRKEDLLSWLFIQKNVKEFTVSSFLPGRHLANQMLYINGELIKNAGLHCAEYVMASIAPSGVTGNTSFGRLINEDRLLDFCEEVMDVIAQKTGVAPHGVYSFDLKEDADGALKITEINVRHMAYTGIMSDLGFDLTSDSMLFLMGKESKIKKGRHFFDKDWIFLRDVDSEPIVMEESKLLKSSTI